MLQRTMGEGGGEEESYEVFDGNCDAELLLLFLSSSSLVCSSPAFFSILTGAGCPAVSNRWTVAT